MATVPLVSVAVPLVSSKAPAQVTEGKAPLAFRKTLLKEALAYPSMVSPLVFAQAKLNGVATLTQRTLTQATALMPTIAARRALL